MAINLWLVRRVYHDESLTALMSEIHKINMKRTFRWKGIMSWAVVITYSNVSRQRVD